MQGENVLNTSDVDDRLFAIEYELKELSRMVQEAGGERWVSGFTRKKTNMAHVTRYMFASQYVKDKKVLDIACGSGGGSAILADHGVQSIVSVDRDQEAIRYAKIRHGRSTISYICSEIG